MLSVSPLKRGEKRGEKREGGGGGGKIYTRYRLLKMEAYMIDRGQTWHRPDDVEAAFDKSLEDLGLDYGNTKTPASKKWAHIRSWIC